jgi:hypothetical protein
MEELRFVMMTNCAADSNKPRRKTSSKATDLQHQHKEGFE